MFYFISHLTHPRASLTSPEEGGREGRRGLAGEAVHRSQEAQARTLAHAESKGRHGRVLRLEGDPFPCYLEDGLRTQR